MASARAISNLAVLAMLVAASHTQPTQATSGGRVNRTTTPSSTSRAASSTAPDQPVLTEAIIPAYLYSAVGSLITQYFPSTTPINLPAVSWPSTLVVGTATYVFPAQKETSSALVHNTPSLKPSPTSSARKKQNASTTESNDGNDKKLGIILGVVIGAIALAIMAVLFCCLARRRRRTGSFFMRRSMSSTGSQRLGAFGTTSNLSGDSPNRRNMSEMRQTEPTLLRPAMLHHHSSRSTSEDVPFYTPMERHSGLFARHELDGQHIEQSEPDPHDLAHRRSSSSVRDERPPTPFSPAMMLNTTDRTRQQQRPAQNPFASPEDQEADHIVSPLLPSKSFERWNSPIVHYPSMDEVSEFDFAGQGRRQASVDGGNYWHPSKQRVDGRYELA